MRPIVFIMLLLISMRPQAGELFGFENKHWHCAMFAYYKASGDELLSNLILQMKEPDIGLLILNRDPLCETMEVIGRATHEKVSRGTELDMADKLIYQQVMRFQSKVNAFILNGIGEESL